MNQDNTKIRLLGWGIFLLLSLVWGSSFMLIKKALLAFDATEVACFRIGLSALAFLPVVPYYWTRIPWEKWKALLVVGFAGTGIPAFLFPIAQTQISSSLSGILNALTPLFALIIGALAFHQLFERNKVVGVLLGLAGACVLIRIGGEGTEGGNNWYALFVVAAAVCYAVSLNTVKYHFQNLPAIPLSAITFTMIGLPAIIYLFVHGTFTKFSTVEGVWFSFGAVAALALFCTVMATVIFFKLVQLTNVVFSSMIAYFIPLTAIFLGFLDGENITMFHFIGMGLILFGVYLSRAKTKG